MPRQRYFSALILLAILGSHFTATGVRADPPGATELQAGNQAGNQGGKQGGPRIVNIFNFCRNTDVRLANSEQVMLKATTEQIKLVHANHLNGTWALQYDALMNPQYQSLMKEQLSSRDEVAAWWEIPRPLVLRAGLKWRGFNADWDLTSSVDYSTGYKPEERRQLVDAYMADFQSIFGHYPRTVGGWYIDEISLAYMVEKYGIVASCNCKDGVRTSGDPTKFATLWGGYWNQAYYPSKAYAYMPAQTRSQQIDVPVFRMLGSDPIYQFARIPSVYSLEPVNLASGASTKWVDWYFKSMIEQPSLAFAYAQVGQENYFGWDAMKQGLTYQLSRLDEASKRGEIRVETMQTTGQWFKSHFELTPPTAVVCMDDWRYQGRKSVWYDSRYYRVNLFWDKNGICIRDLHRFDENKISAAHDGPLKSPLLKCGTLPIVESALWAPTGQNASAVPVTVGVDGTSSRLQITGDPVVSQASDTELKIVQPLMGNGSLTVACAERSVTFDAADGQKQPYRFAWQLNGGDAEAQTVQNISDKRIDFKIDGFPYALVVREGVVKRSSDGKILLQTDDNGRLTLQLSE
jgi:hypothetical protein